MKKVLIVLFAVFLSTATHVAFADECTAVLDRSVENFDDLKDATHALHDANFCHAFYLGMLVSVQDQIQKIEEGLEKDPTHKEVLNQVLGGMYDDVGLYGDLSRQFSVRKGLIEKRIKKGF